MKIRAFDDRLPESEKRFEPQRREREVVAPIVEAVFCPQVLRSGWRTTFWPEATRQACQVAVGIVAERRWLAKKLRRSPIQRMNRFQYNNAVQDLFQLSVVFFPLPERVLQEHGNYF